MTLSVEEIIYKYCEGRLHPYADYYEGRGNSLYDLNSPLLELLYKGIHAEIGAEAAKAFVNMVKNLKDTNASNFLAALYRLEKKDWRYGDPVLKVRVQAANGPVEDQKPETAPKGPMRRVTEVLNAFRRSGSSVGHNKEITESFLSNHKSEVEASLISRNYSDVAG